MCALLVLSLAGCATQQAQVPSDWPPPDFRLVVEELRDEGGRSVVQRRFTVTADGYCVYGRAGAMLIDADTQTALPVFGRLSVYRLLEVNTRLLARKLYKRGINELKDVQGDQKLTNGESLRISYTAFKNQPKVVVASGQIYGTLARIVHVINAHLPAGERFELPGLSGDPDPVSLRGVPAPADDLRGALQAHRDMLAIHPGDEELLLDAFALACKAGERAVAQELLARWSQLHGAGPAKQPFLDPPQITVELLQRLLPG